MNSIKKIENKVDCLNKKLHLPKEVKNCMNSSEYINKIKKKKTNHNLDNLNRNENCQLKTDEHNEKMGFSSSEKTYENNIKNKENSIHNKNKCTLISKINKLIHEKKYGCSNKELNTLKYEKDKKLLPYIENVISPFTKKKKHENKCKLIHINKENNQKCTKKISDKKNTECNFIKKNSSYTKNSTDENSILRKECKKKNSFKNEEWNILNIPVKPKIKFYRSMRIDKKACNFEKSNKGSFRSIINTDLKNKVISENPTNEIEQFKQHINNKNKPLNKFEIILRNSLHYDYIINKKKCEGRYTIKNEENKNCNKDYETHKNSVEPFAYNKSYTINIRNCDTNLKNSKEGNEIINKNTTRNGKTEYLKENNDIISHINGYKASKNLLKKNLVHEQTNEKLISLNLKNNKKSKMNQGEKEVKSEVEDENEVEIENEDGDEEVDIEEDEDEVEIEDEDEVEIEDEDVDEDGEVDIEIEDEVKIKGEDENKERGHSDYEKTGPEVDVETKKKDEEKNKEGDFKKKEKTEKKYKWKNLKNELKEKIDKKCIKEYLNVLKNRKKYKIIIVKNNNKEIGNYIITNKIGKGTFGEVCLGIHMYTYEIVAVKILNKHKLLQMISYDKIMKEIEIHKNINHNHICKFYEVHENKKNLYMILEYLPNGDLLTYIYKNNYINENKARRILYQLISAIEYLHRINVVHRDLKPENILLDYNNNVKLIDFGLSTIFSHNNLLATSCGSPFYTSPEILLGNKYKAESTDVWSLGIILFLLLNHKLPFNHNDLNKLFQKIIKGILHFEPYISLNAKNLIQNMLNVNFKKRYSLSDIKNHIWFTNHNLKMSLTNSNDGCNLIDCDACLYKIILQNNIYYNDFIINKLCKITNVSKHSICNKLNNKKKNFIKTSYHLLFNKTIKILSRNNYLFSHHVFLKKDNIPFFSDIIKDSNNEISSCNNSTNNSSFKIIKKQKNIHSLRFFNINQNNNYLIKQKSSEKSCIKKNSNANSLNINNKIHDSTDRNNSTSVRNYNRNTINIKTEYTKINIFNRNNGNKINIKEEKSYMFSNKPNNCKTSIKKYSRVINTVKDDKTRSYYIYLKNKSNNQKNDNNSNNFKYKSNFEAYNNTNSKNGYRLYNNNNNDKTNVTKTRLNSMNKIFFHNNHICRHKSMLTYNEIKKKSFKFSRSKSENNLMSFEAFDAYYEYFKLKGNKKLLTNEKEVTLLKKDGSNKKQIYNTMNKAINYKKKKTQIIQKIIQAK